MINDHLYASKNRLLRQAKGLENINDAETMSEHIKHEFSMLTEKLEYLNIFRPEEKTLLENNGWRMSKHELGSAVISDYLKRESIIKDDGVFLYSLFDEQKGDLIIESMPFVYLENLLNYRNGNLSCDSVDVELPF